MNFCLSAQMEVKLSESQNPFCRPFFERPSCSDMDFNFQNCNLEYLYDCWTRIADALENAEPNQRQVAEIIIACTAIIIIVLTILYNLTTRKIDHLQEEVTQEITEHHGQETYEELKKNHTELFKTVSPQSLSGETVLSKHLETLRDMSDKSKSSTRQDNGKVIVLYKSQHSEEQSVVKKTLSDSTSNHPKETTVDEDSSVFDVLSVQGSDSSE